MIKATPSLFLVFFVRHSLQLSSHKSRMVKATMGILLEWYQTPPTPWLIRSDEALREFLLQLEEEHQFGMLPLDDTHILLLGEEKVLEFIQQELDKMQEEYA